MTSVTGLSNLIGPIAGMHFMPARTHTSENPVRLRSPLSQDVVHFEGRPKYTYKLKNMGRQGAVARGSQELKLITLNTNLTQGSRISNYPAFKKAGSLDHAITTSGLWQCAGLIIINPNENWHYLAHISHATSRDEIADHFKKIDLKLEGCKIFILPGSNLETRYTVREIMYALEGVDPKAPGKVQFLHFPKDHKSTVVSYQGDVWAMADYSDFKIDEEEILSSGLHFKKFWKYASKMKK